MDQPIPADEATVVAASQLRVGSRVYFRLNANAGRSQFNGCWRLVTSVDILPNSDYMLEVKFELLPTDTSGRQVVVQYPQQSLVIVRKN